MRILCIAPNNSPELEQIAACLAADQANKVFMASARSKRAPTAQGVSRIIINKVDASRFEKNFFGFMFQGLKTAQHAANAYQTLKKQGLAPELVLSCASNGMAFGLRQVFPDAFMVSYADTKLENFKTCKKELYDARMALQAGQFLESDLVFGADGNFPALLPAVDTAFFQAKSEGLAQPFVTILGGSADRHDLALIWHLAESLLKARARIKILAENNLRDVCWEDLKARYPDGLEILYSPSNAEWRESLGDSCLVLGIKADNPVRQRVLEAMSCGKIVALDKIHVRDFREDENVLVLGEARPLGQIRKIMLRIRQGELRALAESARRYVVENYEISRILPPHLEFVLARARAHGQTLQTRT